MFDGLWYRGTLEAHIAEVQPCTVDIYCGQSFQPQEFLKAMFMGESSVVRMFVEGCTWFNLFHISAANEGDHGCMHQGPHDMRAWADNWQVIVIEWRCQTITISSTCQTSCNRYSLPMPSLISPPEVSRGLLLTITSLPYHLLNGICYAFGRRGIQN